MEILDLLDHKQTGTNLILIGQFFKRNLGVIPGDQQVEVHDNSPPTLFASLPFKTHYNLMATEC